MSDVVVHNSVGKSIIERVRGITYTIPPGSSLLDEDAARVLEVRVNSSGSKYPTPSDGRSRLGIVWGQAKFLSLDNGATKTRVESLRGSPEQHGFPSDIIWGQAKR